MATERSDAAVTGQSALLRRLLLEKVPLLALSVAFSVVTFYAQRAGGAIAPTDAIPLDYRVANALTAYGAYLVKMVWPASLAVLYPLPTQVPLWQVAGAFLLLAGVSVAVFRLARRAPYLPVGWLWYLGTLVPVIGLVQVGIQSMADRYTYIPLIGIFVMIAWGVPELVQGWQRGRDVLATLAAALLVVLSVLTWHQIGYWRNSLELFTHTLRVTSDNYTAHLNLGMELMGEGRTEEAIDHYQASLQMHPDNSLAHLDLGVALATLGRDAEAMPHYLESLRLNSGSEVAHFHLGVSLLRQGRTDEAVAHFREALAINPDYFYAHYNLGLVLAGQGRLDEAIRHFTEAVRLRPDFAQGRNSLGLALAREGRLDAAIGQFSEAVRLNPVDPDARANLKAAKAQLRKASPY